METKKPELRKENGWTVFDVVVNLRLGLCARPSSQLVMLCSNFPRQVEIKRKDERAPHQSIAKLPSMIGLLMLAAGQGTALTVMVEGEDEPALKLAEQINSFLSRNDDY